MKTKGALVWDFHQPWSVEEIEIGEPRRGEVKVALEVAGMCHSDHHIATSMIFARATTSPHRSSRHAVSAGHANPGIATCATSVWG